MNTFLLFFFILISNISCERINYVNPIIRLDAPDPSVIKGDGNYSVTLFFYEAPFVR